jgi:endonuclease I
MKKRHLLLTAAAMLCCMVWAQGPNESGTYYKNANGKSGKALKTALANIIVNPRNVGYSGLYDGYKKTDTRADGYVRDWYSNTTNYVHGVDNKGNYSKEGDMYNREHSVPQSWFGSGDIKSDIVHVLPTDGYVNNRRSNYPFGEVNNVTYQSNNGYSKLGSCKTEGYSGTVFEPNDEIKGDIARIYFYMITRYEDACGSWGHDVFTTTYPGLTTWTLNMMMRWSKQDPVDAVEIARNNAVYEVQGNRNPYVDYPGLEEYTWGSKMSQAFNYSNYEGGSEEPPVVAVAVPVISPNAGTYVDEVTVTLTCETEGAVIYYTLDGTDATDRSAKYVAPFKLTETSVLHAVAVKEGVSSDQATATYTITQSGQGGGETPVADGDIALNNAFFGTSFTGAINGYTDNIVGTKDGMTVVYSLGEGSNRYVSDEQIRLYPNNMLTFSVAQGNITSLQFEFGSSSPSTDLVASDGGSITDGLWRGEAQTVTILLGSGKHARLTNVKFSVSTPGGSPQVYGDLTGDGVVNALDIQTIINASINESTDAKFDFNNDGLVNALDIQKVIMIAAAQ